MDVIQFLLLGLVLPIVINKTTERGRFDFIHAYLQEIWSGLLILCTYLYVLRNPTVKAILLSGYSKLSDYRGYLIVAGLSAALGCFYWWGTGKLLKEIKTPPMHPPHA